MKNVLVVTTINNETHRGINRLVSDAATQNYELVLIGDKKSSEKLNLIDEPRLHYHNLESQLNSKFLSGSSLPLNHYARKNYGYLIAADMGCDWISETDDDNRLFDTFWDYQMPNKSIKNSSTSQWVNIYSAFGFGEYWHRGIPINEVKNANLITISELELSEKIGCIQGIADGDPDIDSICRMLYQPTSKFPTMESFIVEPGYYAPTNSQLTRWNAKIILPLLYLPSTVPWRVSDIWRGLIAQRYFAISNLRTQFRGGIGFQDRNEHNLLKDFEDEIEVHLSSHVILEILESIDTTEKSEFMLSVYSAMLERGIVLEEELIRLKDWLADISTILKKD